MMNSKKSHKGIIALSMVFALMIVSFGTVYAYAAGSVPIITEETDILYADAATLVDGNEAIVAEEETQVDFVGDSSAFTNIPIGQLRASGDLAAGSSYSYDYQYLAQGQKVTINATWTPTGSNIQIGLKSSGGTVTAKTVSGGSGSVTYTINSSGYYYIYIGNPSLSSVKFSISYIVN